MGTILIIFIFFLFIIFLLLLQLFRKFEILLSEIYNNKNDIIFILKNNTKEIENIIKKEFIFHVNNSNSYLSRDIQSYSEKILKKIDNNYKEQSEFIKSTEKSIENINYIITNKLQSSLNFHLGKSFEIIGKHLTYLQEGLGEMKVISQDMMSLKRTLNNVKICGSFSEMQLSMLLQEILAPEQYEKNVVTKSNTKYVVEFAIKLPGNGVNKIWLPIDVKFPKDTYEKLQKAYSCGNKKDIDLSIKNMESVIKKMSKDIQNKYLDPPNTTDFAILFLPFEGIYSEITKNSKLLEEILKKYKTIIAGPSTLAAILNSLQVGFKTLCIQKKTSEIWVILESIRQEFNKFGLLLNQAKDKLNGASKDIDVLLGMQYNLVDKKLSNIEYISKSNREYISKKKNK